MIYFMAVTNDCYELPVCIVDSQKDLARYLNVSDSTIYRALKLSKSGVVTKKDTQRRLKYFRMDSRTGKIIHGETPLTGFAALRAELEARKAL